MKQTVQLVRLWGIPIGFNQSWLLLFAIVTGALAFGYIPRNYSDVSVGNAILLSLITTLLFFASVVIHELAHVIAALYYKIRVRAVTLFFLGGLAELRDEPRSPKSELVIALLGPVASLATAGLFYLLHALSFESIWIAAPLAFLYKMNLLLAGLYILPAFPLDGGRIFRAILWHFSNFKKATTSALMTSQLVAFGLVGFGLYMMIGIDVLNGLWVIMAGWFLNSVIELQRLDVHHLNQYLDDVPVEQVMLHDWEILEGNVPVSAMIEKYISGEGPRFYFVYDSPQENQPDGLITMSAVEELERDVWSMTPIKRLMVAWHDLITVEPNAPLVDALQQMEDRRLDQVPVIQRGELVGVLTKENILRYIRTKAELSLA